ncbi:MAG: RHS repeat-associated core domain-containing protein [Chlamydiales bacterium]|nr:RHS repeat-associated core domain-containing protein [Chlamydiales bacterium]
MFRFLLLLLAATASLFAELKDPSVLAATDGDPQITISRHVNALTGDFTLFQDDHVIQAVEPLSLRRFYVSGDGRGSRSGWIFFPQTQLTFSLSGKTWRAYVGQPSGGVLVYKDRGNDIYLPDLRKHGKGVTNTAHGVISGRTNLKNSRLINLKKASYKLVCADGTERFYKRKRKNNVMKEYLLHSERLPNQNQIFYEYDTYHRLTLVKTTNPSNTKTYAWARFHYLEESKKRSPADFNIETSDGKLLEYRFVEEVNREGISSFRLNSIKTPEHPTETIEYTKERKSSDKLLRKRLFPEGRELFVEYYSQGTNDVAGQKVKLKDIEDPRCDRVKTLYEQAGPNGELIPAYHFLYQVERKKKRDEYVYKEHGVSEVIDALGCRTAFRFNPSLFPTSIESFDEKNQRRHYLHMAWNEAGELQSKTLSGPDGKEIWTREFFYDEKGNVLEERFLGDLTGLGGRDSYTKKTRYTEENLPSRVEEESGAVTLFTYLPGTPLVRSQLQCDGDKILKREFHQYDADNLPIRTVVDDGAGFDEADLSGVTYRKIVEVKRRQTGPALGFPEEIEQRYLDLISGKEKLLGRCIISYRADGRPIKREIYDAEGLFSHALRTEYDAMGRPCEETNAIGQVQKIAYDLFGNRVRQESFCEQLIKEMVYDKMDRLRQVTETGFDKLVHTSRFEYDTKGRKSASIDHFGNATRYTHNPIGSSVETHYPEVFPWSPKSSSTVDVLGREILRVDERGDSTEISYNAYGKPIRTQHPDGSVEKLIYHKDGSLAEKIDVKGAVSVFSYDVFGREIEKKIYDEKRTLLFSERAEYKGDLQISKTDPVGQTVYYFYDGAGRRVSQEDGFQKITFGYDSLGRPSTTATSDGTSPLITVKEHDLLDRVIEERAEDGEGNTLTRVLYSYDASCNRSSVTKFINGQESTERFVFDSFKRPVAQTDALGFLVETLYDENERNAQGQRVLKKRVIDARGVSTTTLHDALGRVTQTEGRGASDELLSLEKFFYDLGGKCCKQESTLISAARPLSTVTTVWEHGVMGRLLSLTKAAGSVDQRVERYRYDEAGLLREIIKPDGVHLIHEYDALGRKVRLFSSDQSIDYAYAYDPLGRMVSNENLLNHKATTRIYDRRGCLTQEVQEGGASIAYKYDPLARRTALLLADRSSVSYHYDALYLRGVERLSADGDLLYTHKYTEYDQAGNLLSEELAAGVGAQTRTVDMLGRAVSLSSPYFTYAISEFDPSGNILQIKRAEERRSFAYDGLSQLTREKDHTYVSDSHQNRRVQDGVAHTHNALNELLKTEEEHFSYDANGNPILQQMKEEQVRYYYDALDRLIQVISPERYWVIFTYDGLHRRTSKVSYLKEAGTWKESQKLYFLYDDQNEIGAMDDAHTLCQLRILGSVPRAEAGAAVALELDGLLFIPQHDLLGNVVGLISPQTRTLVEKYDYTAFGEEIANTEAPRSPWRYQSKRTDEETHLVYFGRRYYMPSLGRWLTTDPKGYTALSSLYAFCSNNPLTRFDLYGLEDLLEKDLPQKSESRTRSFLSSLASFARNLYAFATETSGTYSTDPSSKPSGAMYVNGILTTQEQAFTAAKTFSELGNGIQVTLMHNASNGPFFDIENCIEEYMGKITREQILLKKEWEGFVENNPPGAEMLVVSSSGGSIIVHGALQRSSPEIRDRITSISVGGGKIIPRGLCHRSYNYMSKRDFVSRIDATIRSEYADQLIVLDPHEDAPFHDHSILSPTFRSVIEGHIKDYQMGNRRE